MERAKDGFPYRGGREYNASFPREAEEILGDVGKIAGKGHASLARGASDHMHTGYRILVNGAGAEALAAYHEEQAEIAFRGSAPWAMADWWSHSNMAQRLREWATNPAQ